MRQFLTSEQRTITVTGFNGINDARHYAGKHFGHRLYGISYDSSGIGKRAIVKATKTSQPMLQEKTQRLARFFSSTQKAKQAIDTVWTQANEVTDAQKPAAKRHKPNSEVSFFSPYF